MLDSMQNTILNKPDSAFDRRANEAIKPTESKAENNFQKLLAKQAKSADSTDTEKMGIDDSLFDKARNMKSSAQNVSVDNRTQSKHIEALAQKMKPLSTSNTATTTKTTSTLPSAADSKDGANTESKVGLQEKTTKNTSGNTKIQENPLLEALSTPLGAGAHMQAALEKEGKENATRSTPKISNPAMNTMPKPTQAVMDNTIPATKTLADVEKFAKTQGLNPSKVVLETEHEQKSSEPKAKVIPASAKENISYEYENNVDRIAIVQRGTRKPKNITSKINAEYPSKKTEGDVGSGNTLASLLKDTPQQG